MNPKAKERLWLWDNLKCFLILCVVIGHFVDMYEDTIPVYKSIFLFVNLFHMPLFIYVFGVFAKSSIFGKKMSREKILYYLILYFILKMLIMVVEVIQGEDVGYRLFDDRGVQWYMFALVLFLTVGRVFREMKPLYAILLSVFVACMVGYDSTITSWLSLGRLVNFMPFFLLGLYSDPGKIVETVKKPAVRVTGLVVIGIVLYLCFFQLDAIYWIRPMLTGVNAFSSLPRPAFGCVVRLLYYVFIAVIGFAVIACMPAGKNIFSFIGKHTLQIYFWHRPILYLISPYVGYLNEWFGSCWWIAFLGGAVLMTLILAIPVFGKPMEWLNWHCRNCWKGEEE